MAKFVKKIALYGGSFDPPHKSHIQLIRNLEKLPYLDEVWLLPCGDRTDKKLLLSKDARFNLMRKIFAKEQKIKVVDYQIQMCKKLGRMVHTYELLKAMAQMFQNCKFHFVIGGDIIEGLETWGNGKQLKQQFDFIIFQRKGYQMAQDKMPLKFNICEDDLPQMSSSSIKRILWDEKMPKEQKLGLIQDYLPKQAIECLNEEKIL